MGGILFGMGDLETVVLLDQTVIARYPPQSSINSARVTGAVCPSFAFHCLFKPSLAVLQCLYVFN